VPGAPVDGDCRLDALVICEVDRDCFERFANIAGSGSSIGCCAWISKPFRVASGYLDGNGDI
jgi:hypothetical protein